MPVVTTRGKGFEDELVKQTRRSGLPATTSIRSAIRALAHPCSQVAAVTPIRGIASIGCVLSPRAASNVVADHTMDVVFKQPQDVTPRTRSRPPAREVSASVGRRGLHPVQSVVGGGRRAADRERAPNPGGDRRPRRLLGGVPPGRYPRSDRRAREADAQARITQHRRSQQGRERVFRLEDKLSGQPSIRALTLLAAARSWQSRRCRCRAGFLQPARSASPSSLRRRRQRRPAGSAAWQQACRHLGTAGRGRQPRGRSGLGSEPSCGGARTPMATRLTRNRRSVTIKLRASTSAYPTTGSAIWRSSVDVAMGYQSDRAGIAAGTQSSGA